jgi:hypothetical protein
MWRAIYASYLAVVEDEARQTAFRLPGGGLTMGTASEGIVDGWANLPTLGILFIVWIGVKAFYPTLVFLPI